MAVYAALITDIRRAWHAIRIYEHFPLLIPTLIGSPQRSFENEEERRSFTVIATQRSGYVYTLERQIEQLLRGTDWTERLLKVFSSSNVTTTIKTSIENENTPESGQGSTDWHADLRRDLDEISLLYSADGNTTDFRGQLRFWAMEKETSLVGLDYL